MLFAKEIGALKTQVEQLIAQISTLTAEKEQLTEANAKCEQRFSADQATIQALTGERDGLQLQVTELAGKLEKAGEEVETKVIEKVAAAGVPAIKRDPGAVDPATDPAAENTGAGRTKSTWARDFGGKR